MNRHCKNLEGKVFSDKLRNKLVGRAPTYIVNWPSAVEKEEKTVRKRPARMYADVFPFGDVWRAFT